MSLIEEALRRVKDPLVPQASTTAEKPRKGSPSQAPTTAHPWSTTPGPSPSQPAAAPQLAPLTMVTLAVLALTAALIFGGAIWMWRTLNSSPSVAKAPVSPATSEPSTAAPPEGATRAGPPAPSRAITASTHELPEFHLTGVVEGLGEPYAVINGSIVGVGETVGKATLLDIAEGNVTLRLADGKDTVLRVER